MEPTQSLEQVLFNQTSLFFTKQNLFFSWVGSSITQFPLQFGVAMTELWSMNVNRSIA